MPKALPGLFLVAFLTLLAYGAARLPFLSVVGPLVVGLLLGMGWRAVFGLPGQAEAGARFAAKTILKVGIALLGVRLDFLLLAQVGPAVLLGLFFIERLGRRLGLSRGLRLALAVGTSICGASAIVAAAPIIGARDEEIGVSVSVISVLGTLLVLAYLAVYRLLEPSGDLYGVLVGSIFAGSRAGGRGGLHGG